MKYHIEYKTIPTQEPMEWESELRQEFADAEMPDLLHSYLETRDLINFVKSQIKQAEEREQKRIFSKIGFMRQWLNEDRIKDPERMVTSEQLLSWLINQNNE